LSVASTVDANAPRVGKGGGATGGAAGGAIKLGMYDRMKSIAANSVDKGIVQLNQMEAGDQEYVLDVMSGTLGRKPNASEIDIRLQPDGNFIVVAQKDLRGSDNKLVFKRGQPLGSMSADQITIAEAGRVGGVKLKREVAQKQADQPAPPKTTGKKKIAGF
jgi:hypothetical protein